MIPIVTLDQLVELLLKENEMDPSIELQCFVCSKVLLDPQERTAGLCQSCYNRSIDSSEPLPTEAELEALEKEEKNSE